MARPKKTGLDYFPVDVVFDDKIQSIELTHKNNGFVWVIKFWQSAYQTESGEIPLDGLFGELHANKCRITTEEHLKILETALSVGFCYKTETGLYTSNGIKKRIGAVSHERAAAIERQGKRKNKRKSRVKKTPHYSPNNLNEFKIPEIQEVIEYFIANGYTEDLAKRFFNGYNIANWKDKNGDPVINWKQKAIHVWFRPEQKATPPHPTRILQ